MVRRPQPLELPDLSPPALESAPKRLKIGGGKWSDGEIARLLLCYISVSEDPVEATDRAPERLWEQIQAAYAADPDTGVADPRDLPVPRQADGSLSKFRTADQCRSKFYEVRKKLSFYKIATEQVARDPPTGSNAQVA